MMDKQQAVPTLPGFEEVMNEDLADLKQRLGRNYRMYLNSKPTYPTRHSQLFYAMVFPILAEY
jgi:hypothetical protein